MTAIGTPGLCAMCEEPYSATGDITPLNGGRQYAHRECMLRCVTGGIGHLTDHPFWCTEMHDPDGGLSYRQSALAVGQWVHDHAR